MVNFEKSLQKNEIENVVVPIVDYEIQQQGEDNKGNFIRLLSKFNALKFDI